MYYLLAIILIGGFIYYYKNYPKMTKMYMKKTKEAVKLVLTKLLEIIKHISINVWNTSKANPRVSLCVAVVLLVLSAVYSYYPRNTNLFITPNTASATISEAVKFTPTTEQTPIAEERPLFTETPVTSKNIKPSTAEQKIELNKDVSVIIPSNYSIKDEKVFLTALSNGPTFGILDYKRAFAYKVDMGTDFLATPLTLKFAYDASNFTEGGITPDLAFSIHYRNNDSNYWMDSPYIVNAQDHTLEVKAYSPAEWEVSMVENPSEYKYIKFNATSSTSMLYKIKSLFEINIASAQGGVEVEKEGKESDIDVYDVPLIGVPYFVLLKKGFNGNSFYFIVTSKFKLHFSSLNEDYPLDGPGFKAINENSYLTKTTSKINNAYLTLYYLQKYYDIYTNAGFTPTGSRVDIYDYGVLEGTGAGGGTTGYFGAAMNGPTPAIYINKLNPGIWGTEECTRGTLAHELFHVFQSASYNIPGWISEAGATYAQNNIANPDFRCDARTPYINNYFDHSVDYFDNIQQYMTAYFLEVLVKEGIDFKGIQEIWSKNKKNDNKTDFSKFAEYIKSKGKDPADIYTKYAQSRLEIYNEGTGDFGIKKSKPIVDNIDQKALTEKFIVTLLNKYSAKLIEREIKDLKENEQINISASFSASSNTMAKAEDSKIYVYTGEPTNLKFEEVLDSSNVSLDLDIYGKDKLGRIYFLIVNTSLEDNITVSVEIKTIEANTLCVVRLNGLRTKDDGSKYLVGLECEDKKGKYNTSIDISIGTYKTSCSGNFLTFPQYTCVKNLCAKTTKTVDCNEDPYLGKSGRCGSVYSQDWMPTDTNRPNGYYIVCEGGNCPSQSQCYDARVCKKRSELPPDYKGYQKVPTPSTII